jgi:flagellar basal body L-ring protein FlgH
MPKKTATLLCLLALAAAALLQAESLWRDKGDPYSSQAFRQGDPVKIVFRNKRVVEFSTFQENYESSSLNNPDKSSSMVLNFLPPLAGDNANKSSRKAQVKNADKLNFTVMATVQSVDSNGNMLIAGRHRITVNNQVETAEVSGVVNPRYIRGDKVWSDDVADLAVSYDRFVFKKDLFGAGDFSNITSKSNLGLSDSKKQELILKYFNQVLPLLFQ